MSETPLKTQLPSHVKVALTLAAIVGLLMMGGPSTVLFMTRSIAGGLLTMYVYGHWFLLALIACFISELVVCEFKKREQELFGLKYLSIAFLIGLAGHCLFGMYLMATIPG